MTNKLPSKLEMFLFFDLDIDLNFEEELKRIEEKYDK